MSNQFEKLKEMKKLQEEALLGDAGENTGEKEGEEMPENLTEEQIAELEFKRKRMDISAVIAPAAPKAERRTISVIIDADADDVLIALSKTTGKSKSRLINDLLISLKKETK